jgi:hypothetical protein|nr:MAG TPA: hypothetical protein [Caudoviricetes sp.]
MNIELKVIDKDTLKVGDWVGVAKKVSCGWSSSFRHQLITPAQITRITPKRTKFFTDKFGEHNKREIFYEPDSNAVKENHLAMLFANFQDGVYEIEKLKRNMGLAVISDEDLLKVSDHMKAITDILEKYKEK